MSRTHVAFICLFASLILVAPVTPRAHARQQDTADAAYRHLHDEIGRYLEIHSGLRAEVPGPVPDSSARELNVASDALFNAIRRARPRGRQGDFFDAAATRLIRQRLLDAIRTPNVAAALAEIDDELPAVVQPQVYLRFPMENQMATMLPSVLEVLPRLPPELEYRIVGEHLVLRDVKAAMIVDYIPAALPRK